eukprot:m.32783 g.32783  ORF g.32783 m.32783 type:complete len:405 (-) comp8450_c1_seq1:34-1248(-)
MAEAMDLVNPSGQPQQQIPTVMDILISCAPTKDFASLIEETPCCRVLRSTEEISIVFAPQFLGNALHSKSAAEIRHILSAHIHPSKFTQEIYNGCSVRTVRSAVNGTTVHVFYNGLSAVEHCPVQHHNLLIGSNGIVLCINGLLQPQIGSLELTGCAGGECTEAPDEHEMSFESVAHGVGLQQHDGMNTYNAGPHYQHPPTSENAASVVAYPAFGDDRNPRKSCCACECSMGMASRLCPHVGCHATQYPETTLAGFWCTLSRKSWKYLELRKYLGRLLGLGDASHLNSVLVKKGKVEEGKLGELIRDLVRGELGIELVRCAHECEHEHTARCLLRWLPTKGHNVEWPTEHDEEGLMIAKALDQKLFKRNFKSDMVICGCHFKPREAEINDEQGTFVPHLPPQHG